MNITRLIGPSLGLVAALSLAACGGGSSSGGTTTPPPAPVPTAVTAVGSITGFGSVYVNGAKYEVAADTVIAIEDNTDVMGDDSVLLLGMKVTVRGFDDSGVRTASHIEFDEDLKGPIDSVTPDSGDPTIGTIEVMTKIVTIDTSTVLDDDIGDNDGIPGIDIRDLQVDMIVEVSGFPTDSGILATRVDRELDAAGGNPDVGDPGVDDDELEFKGYVESIAGDNLSIVVDGVTFIVNGQTIYEDGLMLNDDLLRVFVEVHADLVAGDFVAVRIEREDGFDDDHEGEFEIEGILESINTEVTPHTFTINGRTVPVTDATSLAPLVGMRVEIKGSYNTANVLVLREAQLDIEDDVRTEDLIATVGTAPALNFTTRLGLVITVTGDSGAQDDAADDGDHLTPEEFINRLRTGDRMEARGHENADGSVTWTRIERDELALDNNDFVCELRGPVTNITGDAASFTFDIQGVTVSTDNVSDNNFEGENDAILGRDLFFERLQDGAVVEADSFDGDEFCMTDALDARQVELEGGDDS